MAICSLTWPKTVHPRYERIAITDTTSRAKSNGRSSMPCGMFGPVFFVVSMLWVTRAVSSKVSENDWSYAEQMRKTVVTALFWTVCAMGQSKVTPQREASIKADLGGQIDSMKKQAQVMVDTVFSFGELGFQEYETSKYLTGMLEKEGFKIERGVAGIPTAWLATWGSGKPVISLGSDIDDIPQASQKPAVAWHEPMIEGAPGHGEGHNSGVPLNILAALAVKTVMEREHLQGTIQLWPGVAEELVGTKAYFVRAGLFQNVDAVLFTHVANNLGV